MGKSTFDDGAFDAALMALAEVKVKSTCVKIEAAAKRLCPVDTGRLRSSITHDVNRRGRTVVGRVGTNVDYAKHVEFGTRYQSAQPFLRPAAASAR